MWKGGLTRLAGVSLVSTPMLIGGSAAAGVSVGVGAFGVADGPSVQERVAQVETYFDRAGFFGFRGVVLVAQGEEVLFARGYGYADTEAQRRNDPDTLFDVGAITKPIVAAAVLKLGAEGKLSLDDQVREYIPFEAPADDHFDRETITVGQLLGHRSGMLPRGIGGPDFEGIDVENDPTAKFTRYFEVADSGPAGKVIVRNSVGYGALAYIVEQVSGMPFEDYCVEHLFRPAGMDSTGFAGQEHLDLDRAAMGHRDGEERSRAGTSAYDWTTRGARGLVTSANDLHRWMVAVRDGTLLTPEAREQYFSRGPEAVSSGRHFGLGWQITVDPEPSPHFWHSGLAEGFASRLSLHPDDDLVAIVLCNDIDMRVVFSKADMILRGEEVEMPPDPIDDVSEEALEAAAGRWTFPDGDVLEVEVEGDALRATASGITTSERFLWYRQSGERALEYFRDRLATVEEYVSTLAFEGPDALMPGPDADEQRRERAETRLARFRGVLDEIEEEVGEIHSVEATCFKITRHSFADVMLHLECERGDAALAVEIWTRNNGIRSMERAPTAYVATGRLYQEADGAFAMYRFANPDLRIRLGEEDGETVLIIDGDGGRWSRDLVGRRE